MSEQEEKEVLRSSNYLRCKVAWDEVKEVIQTQADLRLNLEKQDPLKSFCQDNLYTDQCQLYDN
ncbi:calvin cycle protein cp12-3 [Quercus suber]|uniref:Calvin cycle protein cp12-3 n=1 Tax=Quercus suber TaxID=58331 RepID=A0AAW0J108_QUESU